LPQRFKSGKSLVASFLTKDLLVHWKEGEAYFARYLLDFDLAANNGGWQWAASTGCDAQPYFRIFNPVSQSEKFDPDGAFIRANVPELNGFSKKRIHWPHEAPASEQNIAHCQLGKDYPHPIVEHHRQRLKCLQMFKAARKP
jgi:deoxyribodipyrimidine photo-lyase